MREGSEELHALYENLDTAYVDLIALVRHLEGRAFTGLVHVELDEYEGDLFLRAGDETHARGLDHAAGRADEGEAALAQIFARAAEPGGLISAYECSVEEIEKRIAQDAREAFAEGVGAEQAGTAGDVEELLSLAGEMIAAVERAALVAGGDFGSALHTARLALAEDFPFLDPFARSFDYAEGSVRLGARPAERLFLSGLCELLRRAVSHVAEHEQRLGVRKDAARELSVLLRRRRTRLEHFHLTPRHLERIAGMKLL